MSRPHRYALGTVFIIGCAIAAAHVSWLPRYVIDDAYISYRYARNLLAGHGLVFNPAERVEGYSNLLWVLMTATGMLFQFDSAAWTQALGCAALFGSIISAAYLTRRLTGSHWAALGTALVLAASTALCSSALNGLETGLFGLLVTLSVVTVTLERWKQASLFMGLAAATRPEGFALFLLAAAFCLILHRRRMNRRRWGGLVVPFAAIVGGLLTFRLCYYGEWLPNSVIAKSAMLPLLRQAKLADWSGVLLNPEGLQYVHSFLRHTVGALAVLAIVPAVRGVERRPAALLMLGVVGLGFSVAVYNFGDWMTSFRLLTPYLPTLAALVMWGVHETVTWANRSTPSLHPALWRTAAACGVLVCGLGGFQRQRPFIHDNPDATFATMLAGSKQPGLLAATDVIGRLGYYAPDVRVLDMAGLTEPYIARHGELSPTFGRSDFEYVLAKRPHVIMNNILSPWRRRLTNGDFTEHYWWVVYEPLGWADPCRPWPRFVFVRRGSVLEDEFRRLLPKAEFRHPSELAGFKIAWMPAK